MLIARTVEQAKKQIRKAKLKNKTVGFVATMGALHQGHLALVRAAKKTSDFVAVSIFVNPAQFGPKEDFKKYPRVFRRDKKLLEAEKIDLVFCPSPGEMYCGDFSTYVEEIYLSKPLCGATRHNHFKGVCTVVAKLFNIIGPDIAYFGRKDYQQAKVIERMAKDLNFPVKIKVIPTVRERDGLAMSSRNAYLSVGERNDAVVLSASIKLAEELVKDGEKNVKKIMNKMKRLILSRKSAKIEYLEIIDMETLRPVDKIGAKSMVAMAVYIGKTRLIDNAVVAA